MKQNYHQIFADESHRQFAVLVSGAGATCGPTSDPNNDHPPTRSGDQGIVPSLVAVEI